MRDEYGGEGVFIRNAAIYNIKRREEEFEL